MDLPWALAGALAGFTAGFALRAPVFMLSVPSGEPSRTTCPRCSAPIRPWFAVRCARCRSSFGRPAVLEVSTAVVLALLLGRLGGHPEVAAFAFLGVVGVALGAIDIAVQRLPDRLTLPAIPLMIALLGLAALAGHEESQLLRALLGSLAMTAGFLLLALLRPGQIGGGDIKLAALLGLAMGWLGLTALLAGVALSFLLGGIAGLALLATRRATLRSQISFGPFMMCGAMLGAVVLGGSHRLMWLA
jgi:leader peptidase (prepilin peptidase) / N-methyltransferase